MFKEGDRVRLVKYIGSESDEEREVKLGDEMVVTSIHHLPNVPFPIYTDEGLWAVEELELVE